MRYWSEGDRVVHPYDDQVLGTVHSQNRYSVVVQWDNGDVDTQGSEALRRVVEYPPTMRHWTS